jgi:hypothetical protein
MLVSLLLGQLLESLVKSLRLEDVVPAIFIVSPWGDYEAVYPSNEEEWGCELCAHKGKNAEGVRRIILEWEHHFSDITGWHFLQEPLDVGPRKPMVGVEAY